jgi:thiol-disulfide isomerase/thioredoxin
MRSATGLVRLVVSYVLFTFFAGTSAFAAPGGFLPIGALVLEVGGKVASDARIYHSDAERSILVRSSAIPSPLIFVPGARKVIAVLAADLEEAADGSVSVRAGAQRTDRGLYEVIDNKPTITLDGNKIRFLDRPPLLGVHERAAVLAYEPLYERKADEYQPQATYMDFLKNLDTEVEVLVYFGSWCPVCARLMPNILRVDADLAAANVRFRYHGVPNPVGGDEQANADGVQHLPTGIVRVGGKEIGRADGMSWRFPDLQLYRILVDVE